MITREFLLEISHTLEEINIDSSLNDIIYKINYIADDVEDLNFYDMYKWHIKYNEKMRANKNYNLFRKWIKDNESNSYKILTNQKWSLK